jgi:c-di-GMP-binding flagellar brake protein YcgR
MAKYEPMNNFFKNTRRHRRFIVEEMDIRIRANAIDETSPSAEEYRAKMLNLGGVLMEGGHPTELNRKLQIEMIVPENVQISITGRVTSCHPAKTKDKRYDVGIEFMSMSEKDRIKLKQFIQWLYLKDAGFTE